MLMQIRGQTPPNAVRQCKQSLDIKNDRDRPKYHSDANKTTHQTENIVALGDTNDVK
jgi:hypothetical protein